jgi:carbon storage regulator
MLILSRKVGESIAIGDNISIFVNRIAGNRVAIGIQAPNDVRVVRGELERFVDEFGRDKTDSGAKAVPVPPTAAIDLDTSTGFVPRSAR